MRDLRTAFARLEAWLRNGEKVEIAKHGEPVARLVPSTRATKRKPVKVDVLARLRSTWVSAGIRRRKWRRCGRPGMMLVGWGGYPLRCGRSSSWNT